MSEKLYKIKPLEWENVSQSEIYKRLPKIKLMAPTILGKMRITQKKGPAKWSYCFTEYYDEGSETFETIQEAKQHAWEFYKERITKALEEQQ